MITTPYSDYYPFFSVILCTFNRAYILHEAVESLLGQTESDWECIIVDDGSKDDTQAVASHYVRNERIRYMHHTNRGPGLSRNAGILASCGMFVTFLDSDDQYAPNHLATRKTILQEYPHLEFLHGGVHVIGNPYVPDLYHPEQKIHISECIVAGTIIARRDAALYIGGFPPVRYGDDTGFYERAIAANLRIAHTSEPTYLYNRTSPDSLCNLVARGGIDALNQDNGGGA